VLLSAESFWRDLWSFGIIARPVGIVRTSFKPAAAVAWSKVERSEREREIMFSAARGIPRAKLCRN
jgi:hypothetical protein